MLIFLHERISARFRSGEVLLGFLLVLALYALYLVTRTVDLAMQLPWAAQNDFVAYWSAARLNLRGGNPYAAQDLFTLEQSIGWSGQVPLLLWTLPYTLAFVMPFALFDYPTAYLLWLFVSLLLLIGAVDLLWNVYEGSPQYRWAARGVALIFAPTIMQLYMGQIGLVVLVGLVGFVVAQRQERWWLAGAALPLIMIKPHVAYLFWVMFAVWWIRERRWPILGGAIVAVCSIWLIPMFINPHVNQQYVSAVAETSPLSIGPTTWGTLLRFWLGWEHEWLAFVPPIAGFALFSLELSRRKATYLSWAVELPWLILLSMSTMAFGWYHDFVLLLPVVIQVLAWITNSSLRRLKWIALFGFMAFESAAYLMIRTEDTYAVYYVWMAPVLLVAYWWLRRQVQSTGALHTEGFDRVQATH